MVKDLAFEKELKQLNSYIAKIVNENYFYNLVSMKELIIAGQVGLYKAFTNFYKQSKSTLVSYSHNYIKKEIIDYQNQLKFPYYSRLDLKNYLKILEYQNGNEDLTAEDYESLEKSLQISKEEINYLIGLSRSKRLAEEEFNEIIHTSHEDVTKSLKDPSYNVDIELLHNELLPRLDKLLNKNSKEAICLLFGLENEKMNITEIANKLSLSNKRVSQIVKGALKKLKNDPILKLLYVEYYYEGYFYGYKVDSYFINDKNK